MLFEVKRTSQISRKDKPHCNCVPMRIFAEPNETGFPSKSLITSIYDGIADDGCVNSWGIEITSLEDLVKFANEVAKEINEDYWSPELILTRSLANDQILCLEIYDDYRE